MMSVYFNGLLLGLSLIMALGPQNIFLIKQDARKNHPVLSALICFFCDFILIIASVTGLHQILLAHPKLQISMLELGAAFLLYYASKALHSVFLKKNPTTENTPQPHNRIQIVLFALGFGLLNPHAIIDTLVIIGSGSSEFPTHEVAFLSGAVTASLLWFSGLTLITHFFANILTKNKVWKGIELFSGLLMGFIGIKLGLDGYHLLLKIMVL